MSVAAEFTEAAQAAVHAEPTTGMGGGAAALPPIVGNLRAARITTGAAFAAEGLCVTAAFTTIPAVREHANLTALSTTLLLAGVPLAAGIGSFVGLNLTRRLGEVATLRLTLLILGAALPLIGLASDLASLAVGYALFGLSLGSVDVTANTRAARLERHYGQSIFASFYAAFSAAGIVAALATAGLSRAGWPVAGLLAVLAAPVLVTALTLREHPFATISRDRAPAPAEAGPLGRAVWARLLPLGAVLLVVCVIDSTLSAWTTVYLHQTLHAALSAAPLGYAAYQTGTITGRSCADRIVRRIGPVTVVSGCALLAALGLSGLALADGWGLAIAAAGTVGFGVSVLIPLSVAAAGRLRPEASEAVIARLNVFNYLGVVVGGAAGGLLGSGGHFRLAYAAPACLATLLPLAARRFTADSPSHSARIP